MKDILKTRLNDNIKVESNKLIESLSFQMDTYLKENILQYVIQHEKEVFETAGFLEGDTDGNKELYFINVISNTKDWIIYLFEKYPELENRINIFTTNTISYICQIIGNYYNDSPKIEKIGLKKAKDINDIVLFLGDIHNNGKFVVKIILDDGSALMYKPRKSENEETFLLLLKQLESDGIKVKVRIPKFLTFGDHSWCEYVIPNNVPIHFNINEYYYNLGKLLCVLYAIGVTDIISDNIMCIDGIPTIIDLESICPVYAKYKDQSSFVNYFDHSVITVGILPVWKYSSMNERNAMSSVLFESNLNAHLPRNNNEIFRLNLSTKDIFIKGFSECYKQLLNFNFEPIRGQFQEHKQRILIHDTSLYSYLQRETNLPEYLHGGNSIDRLVECSIPPMFHNYVKKLSNSILNQIHNNDIPIFYVSQGKIIDGYHTDVVPLDEISIFQRRLSTNDMEFQVKVIDSSISQALEQLTTSGISRPSFSSFHKEINNSCIDAAKMMIEEIYNEKFFIDDEVNWISKGISRIDGRYQADVLDESLYSGTSGLSLLFDQMYRIDNRKKEYLQISNILKNNLRAHFYRIKNNNLPNDYLCDSKLISYHYFPLSYIFLSCQDPQRKDIDEKFIEDVIQYIENRILSENNDCGYLGGIAGYIDFLVELKRNRFYDVGEETILKAYNKLISLEIRQADGSLWPHSEINHGKLSSIPLGGFSHGSSGIAYMLYKLFKLTGDEAVYRRFVNTLKFDRSFFDANTSSWNDGRQNGSGRDMGAWCHGAGGIGLSRVLLIKEGYYDDLLFEELKYSALIIKEALGRNQCVCHGDSGNLEILKMIGEIMKDPSLCDYADTSIKALATKIINREPLLYGDGKEIPTMGLFLGKSGVAYQMMRFFKWGSIPSILFPDFSHKDC